MDEEYLDENLLGDDFYQLTDEDEIDERVRLALRKRADHSQNIPVNNNVVQSSNHDMLTVDGADDALVTNPADNTGKKNVASGSQKCGKANTKSTSVKRLENTISATEVLSSHVKEKSRMKRDYYDKKLELFRLQVIAHQEMSSALKEMCTIVRNHIQNV